MLGVLIDECYIVVASTEFCRLYQSPNIGVDDIQEFFAHKFSFFWKRVSMLLAELACLTYSINSLLFEGREPNDDSF